VNAIRKQKAKKIENVKKKKVQLANHMDTFLLSTKPILDARSTDRTGKSEENRRKTH
jgi:hypothetical protein